MLQKHKVAAIKVLNNPTARVIFILGTLIIAALVGGAPNDVGGA